MIAQGQSIPAAGPIQSALDHAQYNENYKVDVNRGCYIRMHRATGMAIYMYADQPGVFLNDHARPVPHEMAAEAGFDVEPLLRAKRKNDALHKAQMAIEAEYKTSVQRDVIAEHGEYRVVGLGNDLFLVEFEDGSPLSKPVSEPIAMNTFRLLAGIEEEPVKPAKK